MKKPIHRLVYRFLLISLILFFTSNQAFAIAYAWVNQGFFQNDPPYLEGIDIVGIKSSFYAVGEGTGYTADASMRKLSVQVKHDADNPGYSWAKAGATSEFTFTALESGLLSMKGGMDFYSDAGHAVGLHWGSGTPPEYVDWWGKVEASLYSETEYASGGESWQRSDYPFDEWFDVTEFTAGRLSIFLNAGDTGHLKIESSIFAAGGSPIPEPATIILLGPALLGLVVASRKKFKKK